MVLNDYIDISDDRPDSQCWIPFNFLFDVSGNSYKIQENGTCLTVWEVKKIINGFQEIISIMKSNTKRDIFEARYKPFEHTSYEVFFDIKVSDADVDVLEIELWINIAYLKQPGYDAGFRFTVTLHEFEDFTECLKSEFENIMSIVGIGKKN